MRVLQITAYSGWGCTGRIAVGINNALISNGHEGAIAWGRNNTASKSVHTIQIGNSVDQKLHGLYTRLTDKCGFGSVVATKKFIKEIEKYEPDLIQLHIVHGYYINLKVLFKYLKEKEIPVVWTFHDCWAFTGHCPYFDVVGCDKWKLGCHDCQQKKHHPTSWIVDNSKWNWKIKKELFTGIKNMTVVTPSKWLAELVKQSFFKEYRIEVINNGINLDVFKPTYGEVNSRYGIPVKKIVLGVSSSWAKSKGLDDFVKLSKILSKDYVVVLVGLTKEQIKVLPDTIIGIERTDNIRELAELYTAAYVFINPTYEDNYPTTNLEALACGTPVITYKTGGSVEAVQESACGAVVSQGDIQGIATSITEMQFKTDEKRCLFSCDANQNYEEYCRLYEDILEGAK